MAPPGSAPDYLGEQFFVGRGGGQGPLAPPLDPRMRPLHTNVSFYSCAEESARQHLYRLLTGRGSTARNMSKVQKARTKTTSRPEISWPRFEAWVDVILLGFHLFLWTARRSKCKLFAPTNTYLSLVRIGNPD